MEFPNTTFAPLPSLAAITQTDSSSIPPGVIRALPFGSPSRSRSEQCPRPFTVSPVRASGLFRPTTLKRLGDALYEFEPLTKRCKANEPENEPMELNQAPSTLQVLHTDPATLVATVDSGNGKLENAWNYNGKLYRLGQKIQGGDFCQCRRFEGDEEIKIVTTTSVRTRRADQLVLKLPERLNQTNRRMANERERVYQSLDSNYFRLKELGVPVATLYASAQTLVTQEGERPTWLWLCEAMEAPATDTVKRWREAGSVDTLSAEDRWMLDWTKTWISNIVEHGLANSEELINDFKPANVMLNSAGEPCVTDYSTPQHERWRKNLWESLQQWSGKVAGGKSQDWILKYLTDFIVEAEPGLNVHNFLMTGER